jgi:hypothetical protein
MKSAPSLKTPSDALNDFTASQPSRAERFAEKPTVLPALTLDVSVQCFEKRDNRPEFCGDLPFPVFAANAWVRGLSGGAGFFEKTEVFQAQAKIVEWRNGR